MNAEAKAHAEAILAHLHPHSPLVHHIAPERPLSWPTISMQKKSAETTPTSTAATTPGTSAKSPGAAKLTDGALLIDHHPAKLGAFSAKSPLGNVPGASFLISHAMAREATHARLRQEPIAPPSIHMSNVVARVIIGSKLVRKAKAAKERVAFKDALHKAHHEPTVHAEVPSVLDHAAIAVDDMGNIIISASPSTPTSRPGSQRRGSMRTEELKASVAADFKQQLTDIYTVYNPARLSKIPDIMAHFVGREQMLLQELHRKYDMQDEHVHLLGHELEDIEYPTFDASELDEIDTNARGRSDDESEEELEDENLFMRDSQPNSPTPLSPSSFSMYADTPTSDRGGGASRSEFFKLWGGLFGEVTDAEACSSPMPAVSASTAGDSADEDEDDMFTEVDGNEGTEDEDAGIIDDSVTLPPEDYFKLSNEIYSNYLNSRGMSSPRAEIEAEVQAEGNSKTEEDAAGNASGGKAAKKAWHSSLPEGDAELRSAMVKDVEDLLKSHQPKPEEAEEWQMKLAQMAIHLDEILYNYSNSSDEYKDRATLQARLQELAERDHRKKTLKQQQQRLLLLRHSAKCKLAGNCAISAYCGEMKQCWQHMKSCQDSKCKVAHCLSSRFVMSHYVKCKKDLCPLCGPVKPLEAAQHAHHVLLQQQPQKSEASKKALPKRNKGDDGSAATLLDEDACIIS
jgi:E1A/CREB-binding protein